MNPKKFIYINSVSILLEHFKYNNCTTLILFWRGAIECHSLIIMIKCMSL
jgi:hypothetical protein